MMNRRESLWDLIDFAPAQLIHVAARLGIPDLLADGARTSADLATATDTHAPSLHRVLRSLAYLGVVRQTGDRFELTDLGTPLRTGVPGSMRALVLMLCGTEVWRSFGDLEHSVRTGEPAWDRVTGATWFDFYAGEQDKAATFNSAMAEHTRSFAPLITAGYDFSAFDTLVDLGGGNGSLLSAILSATPGLHGVLYDLPTGLAAAPGTLTEAGVADRCAVTPGDFFESVPAGADGYLMKSIIHDWDDDQSVSILDNCRRSMRPGGKVLLVEPVLPSTVDLAFTGAVMSDINMLVITGGRERTEREFRDLYEAAGFELTADISVGLNFHILEGTPT